MRVARADQWDVQHLTAPAKHRPAYITKTVLKMGGMRTVGGQKCDGEASASLANSERQMRSGEPSPNGCASKVVRPPKDRADSTSSITVLSLPLRAPESYDGTHQEFPDLDFHVGWGIYNLYASQKRREGWTNCSCSGIIDHEVSGGDPYQVLVGLRRRLGLAQ